MNLANHIRIEIENKITQLTCELSNINAGMQNLDAKIDAVVELLKNLDSTYQQRDTATKQHIVSSIFPSKLIFDKNIVRTLEINRVLSLVCSIDKGFKGSKKRKHTEFGVLSCGVVPKGFEPPTLRFEA